MSQKVILEYVKEGLKFEKDGVKIRKFKLEDAIKKIDKINERRKKREKQMRYSTKNKSTRI